MIQRDSVKVLVLGGSGMLGHKIFQILGRRFGDIFCSIKGAAKDNGLGHVPLFEAGHVIENLDALDVKELERTLADLRPQVIVNCIGVIKQRVEAWSPVSCITINALLPHRLAATCSRWGGRLIHFSTDCVFSGSRGNYAEDDASDANDLYGRTKYLGEVTAENALTLRTSVIGRELFGGSSLLEWFLSQNHKQVKGYKRAFYSGVTTNHLARVVGDIIEHYPDLSGLYQVAGRTISKYDLLCLLREAFDLDIEIIPDESFCCDRSMKGDKFRRATGYRCPPWPLLVAELAKDATPYNDWRC